jgi:hypothetical protein
MSTVTRDVDQRDEMMPVTRNKGQRPGMIPATRDAAQTWSYACNPQ